MLYNSNHYWSINMEKKANITWDEYFMSMALLSAQRSKDPNTKVGACIVDADHKIVSNGYNGMPIGCDEDELSWNRGEGLDSKYLYVCHAEFNAILNTRDGAHLKGCTLYVTLFPCNECTKYEHTIETKASKKMLELAGVKLRQYQGRVAHFEFK